MKSTLFFNQMTCIDHAMIVAGRIVGGSILPNIIVTGNVDEKESVVVDFSTLKKSMKAIIDAKEDGFDHKLWVDPNEPGVEVDESIDGRIKVKTMFVEFEGPRDAVKLIDKAHGLEQCIADLLQQKLAAEYPDTQLDVEVVWNSTAAHTMGDGKAFFTYVHGLKDSTSWGCNNLAHGHLSYVEVIAEPLIGRMLAQKIASDMNGIVFVKRENVIRETDASITIGYENTLCNRGSFRLKLKKEGTPIAIIDTETTIENLVTAMTQQFSDEALRGMGVTHIMVSEGLQKGAIREVPELINVK